MPTVTPKPVRTSNKAKDMLRFDLDNENETVRNYRDPSGNARRWASSRWRSMIRKILMQEQDHQIDLDRARH